MNAAIYTAILFSMLLFGIQLGRNLEQKEIGEQFRASQDQLANCWMGKK